MTDVVNDQVEAPAPVQRPQSFEEKIAGRFGLPVKNTAEPAPEQEAETATQDEDGFADIDWEGIVLKAPASRANDVKEALMRQADYTQKTQEVAEHRRSLEQARELVQAAKMDSIFVESVQAETRELQIIDAYLAEAAKVNWSEMPSDQMIRTKIELDTVKERRAALQASVADKRAQFQNELKSKMDELRGKSRESISKSINGYSEQTEKEIRAYAESEGLTNQEIDNILLDPRSVKVLHKAMSFEKVKSGTQKATEKATQANPMLKPGASSERMPQKTAQDLNLRKAQKSAVTSRDKANAIENRLALRFGQ